MNRVYATLLAVQVAFGTLPVAGKLVIPAVGAYGLAAIRLLCAGAIFAWLARHEVRAIPWRDRFAIAGCGLLGMAANQLLFLGGLSRTHAVNATVLVTTIPVFTFVVAILTRREKVSWRGAAGVTIAFFGVVYLIGAGATASRDTLLGDVMIMLNAFSYALYLVLVRRYAKRYSAKAIVGIGFPAAALCAAPFGLSDLASANVDLNAALGVAYVVLIPTVFTYLANAWALRRVKASTVAGFIYLQPLVGACLAVFVLHEQISTRLVVSAIAVFLGIYLLIGRNSANSDGALESEGFRNDSP